MPVLLRLPVELLRIGLYALRGLFDWLRGRSQLRSEASVLIKAPRDVVWRLATADRVVIDGPPVIEMIREPLADDPGLFITHLVVSGQERGRIVSREVERDESRGVVVTQTVQHALSHPPELAREALSGMTIEERTDGTLVTTFNELTVRSFRDRIIYPLGAATQAARLKRQCEKDAGTQSRLSRLAEHGLVLSFFALLSFWYLLGWQNALLIAFVVGLHEAGHAAAMSMVGIRIHGIYLVPFFGGAIVPRTAYRTQAQLGFVALMGPGFSLIPTLGLAALFLATGDSRILHAVSAFAIINAVNLLPIDPLDGGRVLNALLGSLSKRLANSVGWIGVLTGLGLGLYLQSYLIGIPFALFAVQRYLGGGRFLELAPLSLGGGTALALAFLATFALHALAFSYAQQNMPSAAEVAANQQAARFQVPLKCDMPVDSAATLDRFLAEGGGVRPIPFVRLLATADRAGHGESVKRRLASDDRLAPASAGGFIKYPQLGEWLRLAQSGSKAEIEAYIAATPQTPMGILPSIALTVALLAHDRFEDALALFPRDASASAQETWLEIVLPDVAHDGAFAKAFALREYIRPHVEQLTLADYTIKLAKRIRWSPQRSQYREMLIAQLTEQLRAVTETARSQALPACATADPAAGSCEQKDIIAINNYWLTFSIRAGLIESLARLGDGDAALPDEIPNHPGPYVQALGSIAASWIDRGEHLKAEELRKRIAAEFASSAANQTTQSDADGFDQETRWALFELAAASTRIELLLARNDVEAAERWAREALTRPASAATISQEMMSYYLGAENLQGADDWHQRQMNLYEKQGFSNMASPAGWMESAYQLKRAKAAAITGKAATAEAALDQARSAACTYAGGSAFQRQEWTHFLQTAYTIKAVNEHHLPAEILYQLPLI